MAQIFIPRPIAGPSRLFYYSNARRFITDSGYVFNDVARWRVANIYPRNALTARVSNLEIQYRAKSWAVLARIGLAYVIALHPRG